jgi:hypothetical protein
MRYRRYIITSRKPGELSEVMADMQNVKSYQYAQLSADKESVVMIPIRKNMTMSPASTEALRAVATMVPCMEVGENCFEDENEWQHIMEDHTLRD